LAEETNEVVDTSEASTVDGAVTPPPTIDLDQKVQVGGKEYSVRELAETHDNYQNLQEYSRGLEEFKEATGRLMNPSTDPGVKKRDARQILLDMNYSPEQVEEWVQVYDQPQQGEASVEQPMQEPQHDPRTDELNQQVLKMRAQMLQQNLENSISSSIEGDEDGKVLMDWISKTKEGEDLKSVKDNIAERVRNQALENLRHRRNYAGSFDDSWVGEEVKKAANKVAKDMLTVIGDTSKIGRVPETAEQTETLYRKDPVKLPDTKGKSFGDVEAQLRDWTSDQILRSLSDPGGDSKA
jgi:phosphatidylserine decarboxylase